MERIEELTLINNAYCLYLQENDKGFQYELFDKENKDRVCDGMFCWSDLEDSLIADPLAAARHYAITDIGIEVNTIVKEALCEYETDSLAHSLEEFGYEYDPFGYGDNYTSRQEGFEEIKRGLIENRIPGIITFLKEIITDDTENALKARGLLFRIEEYERKYFSSEERDSVLQKLKVMKADNIKVEKTKGNAKEEIR